MKPDSKHNNNNILDCTSKRVLTTIAFCFEAFWEYVFPHSATFRGWFGSRRVVHQIVLILQGGPPLE
jgi:hypothetical protein